jgi:uncharacterized protein (DUF1800 family)
VLKKVCRLRHLLVATALSSGAQNTVLAASCPTAVSGAPTATLTVDGVLLTRYALGIRGGALTANLRSAVPLPSTVEATITSARAALDVDDDSAFTSTDALILARMMAGMPVSSWIAGISFSASARRKDADAIAAFVAAGCSLGNVISREDASRFLSHATFGATESEVEALTGGSYRDWLTSQFQIPPTSYFDAIQQIQNSGENINTGLSFFIGQWWKQAVTGPDQLRQRMTFALSQIYVINGDGVGQYNGGAAAYYDILNRNAFGNFRSLLEEVSKSWQMGIYLTHMGNVKENPATGQTPDENYAREVMQLFTIGLWELNRDGTQKLDTQGNRIPTYTQDEIRGTAKVFTGWVNPLCDRQLGCLWGVGWNTTADLARPLQLYSDLHSTSAKRIVGGRTLPADQTPEKDLADTLDALFNHANFCPYIGKQLIQRFTTSNPSPNYVARVTAACENNGASVRGDMKAMLRAILLDPDARGYGYVSRDDWGKLREPVIKYAQFLRVFTQSTANARFMIGATNEVDDGFMQTVLMSPSVFNFYRFNYSPQSIAARGLVAPEFQITNEGSVVGNHNYMEPRIKWPGWLPDGTTHNYASWEALARTDPTAFIDRLDLVLNASRSTPVTRKALADMVASLPASDARKRVTDALHVYFLTPDYLIQR